MFVVFLKAHLAEGMPTSKEGRVVEGVETERTGQTLRALFA